MTKSSVMPKRRASNALSDTEKRAQKNFTVKLFAEIQARAELLNERPELRPKRIREFRWLKGGKINQAFLAKFILKPVQRGARGEPRTTNSDRKQPVPGMRSRWGIYLSAQPSKSDPYPNRISNQKALDMAERAREYLGWRPGQELRAHLDSLRREQTRTPTAAIWKPPKRVRFRVARAMISLDKSDTEHQCENAVEAMCALWRKGWNVKKLQELASHAARLAKIADANAFDTQGNV